jgi:hypothetical protein
MAHLTDHGDWRWTMAVGGGAAAVALVCVLAGLRDRPSDLGLTPYGGAAEVAAVPGAPRLTTLTVLREVSRDRVFIALVGSFFICGATRPIASRRGGCCWCTTSVAGSRC